MILEIEQLIHNRLKQLLGHSGMVVRLADLQPQDGRVFTDSYISVKFKGAENQNSYESHGQFTSRVRTLYYDVITEIKNSARSGHSFALPYLDMIWYGLTGWMPKFPTNDFFFQTGMEPYSETYIETDDASVFIYSQSFKVDIILNQKALAGQQGEDYCGMFQQDICLENFLPTRRCVKNSVTKRNIGIAFWSSGDGEQNGYVYDPQNCGLDTVRCDSITFDKETAKGEPVTAIYNGVYEYKLNPMWVGFYPEWGKNFKILTNINPDCLSRPSESFITPAGV